MGNDEYAISGSSAYLWNYTFGEITAQIYNAGENVGSLTMSNLHPGFVSFSGTGNLVGSSFELVIGNITVPLVANGPGELVISSR